MKPKKNVKKTGSVEEWTKWGIGLGSNQDIQECLNRLYRKGSVSIGPGQVKGHRKDSKIYLYNDIYRFPLYKRNERVDNKWNWKIILTFRWEWGEACKSTRGSDFWRRRTKDTLFRSLNVHSEPWSLVPLEMPPYWSEVDITYLSHYPFCLFISLPDPHFF